MDPGFFSRPPGLWLATLGVAALLLGLGYEAAQQKMGPALEQSRRDLAEQTTRANRLSAENQSLEARLAQAQARLSTARPASREDDEQPETQTQRSRVVHQGEAAILMDGRFIIRLEALLSGPKRAVIRFKVVGGQEGTKVMTVGQDMELTINGQPLQMVLKRILTSSVVISLTPGAT